MNNFKKVKSNVKQKLGNHFFDDLAEDIISTVINEINLELVMEFLDKKRKEIIDQDKAKCVHPLKSLIIHSDYTVKCTKCGKRHLYFTDY